MRKPWCKRPPALVGSVTLVARFKINGKGLKEATAGVEAAFRIEGRDEYDNYCEHSAMQAMRYGVALVPSGTEHRKETEGGKGKGKEPKEGKGGEAAARPTKEPKESMPFKGGWVDGLYEIRYVAQKAGSFALHAWCTTEGGERERLPGSPFTLTVSEGQASASSCFIRGLDALHEQLPLQAGQEVLLHPQLHDAFGNPASAPGGALTAQLKAPDGVHELPVRSRHQGPGGGPSGGGGGPLGSFEVATTPELQGEYTLHILLNGVDINDSPIQFSVEAGAPTGSKSRLLPPTEPLYVGQPVALMLEAIDRYENRLKRGGAAVGARAAGNAASACTVDDNGDGTYIIRFSQNAVGDCKVVARVENVEVAPITVNIQARAVSPDHSKDKPGNQERRNSTSPLGERRNSASPLMARPLPVKGDAGANGTASRAPAPAQGLAQAPAAAPAASERSTEHKSDRQSERSSKRSSLAHAVGPAGAGAHSRQLREVIEGSFNPLASSQSTASTATTATGAGMGHLREVIEGVGAPSERSTLASSSMSSRGRGSSRSTGRGRGARSRGVMPGPKKLPGPGPHEVRL